MGFVVVVVLGVGTVSVIAGTILCLVLSLGYL